MSLSVQRVENRIVVIRGHRVMLDEDLADLYGVTTGALNQAVKRNAERFPEDFMFQLSKEEADFLRSQIVILKAGRGRYRKFLPYAFTEQGVAMLSGVLNSSRAAQVNISIMRAFVALRRAAASHAVLSRRLDELERKHGVHDEKFNILFKAIRELMEIPKSRRRIGF